MNAFMVFSHYERRKVLADLPDIHNNILLSKELGRSPHYFHIISLNVFGSFLKYNLRRDP
jgi:hypothetical protein